MQEAVKHVVLIKFKDGTSEDTLRDLITGYCALLDKIEEMKAFEHGTDVSIENLAKGYTHCFITTFANSVDRDTYVHHPAHEAYVKELLPNIEDILVLDFHPTSVK
jgi:hypothetical protein